MILLLIVMYISTRISTFLLVGCYAPVTPIRLLHLHVLCCHLAIDMETIIYKNPTKIASLETRWKQKQPNARSANYAEVRSSGPKHRSSVSVARHPVLDRLASPIRTTNHNSRETRTAGEANGEPQANCTASTSEFLPVSGSIILFLFNTPNFESVELSAWDSGRSPHSSMTRK